MAALAPESLYRLDGRVAVVTGAAGGLGRWFAAGLGAAGAAVLATDLDEPGLDDLVGVLTDAGVEATALAVDLADEDAPERIVAATVERLGGVHVLVNNAAVNRRMPILEMDARVMGLDHADRPAAAVLPLAGGRAADDRAGIAAARSSRSRR